MLLDRLIALLDAGRRAASAEPAERRDRPRRTVLLKAKVLPVASYVGMTAVNASRTGFAGETSAPLQVSQPIIFSVNGDQFHQGTVRWVRGRRFGVDLDDALSILGCLVEVDPGFLAAHIERPRRHSIHLAGRIAVGSASYSALVRDISQDGMRLEFAAKVEPGQHVLVRLPDRPLLLATIRWCSEDMVGIETAEPIQILRLVYASE